MKMHEASTETIKEAVIAANDDLSIDVVVVDTLLSELEKRLSEDEFVAFCEEL